MSSETRDGDTSSREFGVSLCDPEDLTPPGVWAVFLLDWDAKTGLCLLLDSSRHGDLLHRAGVV